MRSLYIFPKGVTPNTQQETLIVKQKIHGRGCPARADSSVWQVAVTTQVIQACYGIFRLLIFAHGYCYGRILPIERSYRQLVSVSAAALRVEQFVDSAANCSTKLKIVGLSCSTLNVSLPMLPLWRFRAWNIW